MGETFWGLVSRAAADHPDRVLVADDHGRSLTAAQLAHAAEVAAAGLVEQGVGPGDVVSWQLPTTLEAAVLMAAGARLGVVQNPIIPLLRHREVGLIARQVGTRLLVAPTTWRGFDHAAMAADLGLDAVTVEMEPVPSSPEMRLPAGDPATLPGPPSDPDQCRWIYYSSGTTADPKGARHTDSSVMASALGMIERLDFGPDDVYPIAWPFTHIGGVAMMTTAMETGVRLVLFDAFDPTTTADRMATHSPTVLGSATPFFRAFLEAQRRHGDDPLMPRVRGAVGGGAPIPAQINQELIDTFGVRGVLGAYGLTECPMVTCERADDPLVGTTVGPPAPGVEARVVEGELRLKAGQCFLGYVDATLDEAAFDDEGWFRTGDMAIIDEKGRIRITGRLKDVIIRHAENISAQEVEDMVRTHPAVRDAAIVGMPDERTGERVCAVVVLAEGADLDVAALGAHCTATSLARHKCPEQLLVVDAIERNPMGKIVKGPLVAKLEGEAAPRD